jgi:hypothetical protein
MKELGVHDFHRGVIMNMEGVDFGDGIQFCEEREARFRTTLCGNW